MTGVQTCALPIFLFLSLRTETTFTSGGLAWLESQLETNKTKRCFVFQHIHDPQDDSADPSHSYSDMLAHTDGKAFLALMRRYTNAVWFHGHTHLTLGDERYPVSESLGYRSVHIPSLSGVRFYDTASNSLSNYFYKNGIQTWGSEFAEGYVVDVYANRIVLRGVDFAAGANKADVQMMPNEVYTLSTR